MLSFHSISLTIWWWKWRKCKCCSYETKMDSLDKDNFVMSPKFAICPLICNYKHPLMISRLTLIRNTLTFIRVNRKADPVFRYSTLPSIIWLVQYMTPTHRFRSAFLHWWVYFFTIDLCQFPLQIFWWKWTQWKFKLEHRTDDINNIINEFHHGTTNNPMVRYWSQRFEIK